MPIAFNNPDRGESHRWLICPKCGGKTKIKISEDTVLLNFPLFCPQCKRETIIGVIKYELVVSDEPDA